MSTLCNFEPTGNIRGDGMLEYICARGCSKGPAFAYPGQGIIRQCFNLYHTYTLLLMPQPGYKLMGFLKELGFEEDGLCGCGDMISNMNAWGPDGCRRNRRAIVQHLEEQAAKKGIQITEEQLIALVEGAIVASEKT